MSIRPVGANFPAEGKPTLPADNAKVLTADTAQTVIRNITVSTSEPSGGSDGDVWLKYSP